jgi:hypothetical protein
MNMMVSQFSFLDAHSFTNVEVILIVAFAFLISWKLLQKRKQIPNLGTTFRLANWCKR